MNRGLGSNGIQTCADPSGEPRRLLLYSQAKSDDVTEKQVLFPIVQRTTVPRDGKAERSMTSRVRIEPIPKTIEFLVPRAVPSFHTFGRCPNFAYPVLPRRRVWQKNFRDKPVIYLPNRAFAFDIYTISFKMAHRHFLMDQ
jgi:hypothetical protein